VQSIAERKGRVRYQQIERQGVHFVERGSRARSRQRLEAFGREPVGHGGALAEVRQRDDDARTVSHSGASLIAPGVPGGNIGRFDW